MSSTVIDSGNLSDRLTSLATTLTTASLKKQFQAIRDLSTMGSAGEQTLIDFVRSRITSTDLASTENISQENTKKALDTNSTSVGSAYQVLYVSDNEAAQSFIRQNPPETIFVPESEQDVDYTELQTALLTKDYQVADKLTTEKLCELAGERAMQRKWVYFTEVSQFSVTDLQSIDTLWRLYSEDKFGWSKQHELWMRLGKDWERLWTQLIWKSAEGAWTRYPNEFIWDLSAPVGHLPLSNQLRGVRMMDSLLSHPAWGQ